MQSTQLANLISAWQEGRVVGPDGPLRVVRVHETHSAWVFLTATHAFKIRKPVNLGFLDYSTEDKRRLAARTEVFLGHRVSPQVYLGVWTIADAERPRLAAYDGIGEPVIAMARLADELQLEHLFTDPNTPAERIDDVATSCATFHAACSVDRRADGYGSLTNTIAAWTINFEQIPESDATVPLSAAERAHLIDQTQDWLQDISPQLTQRIAEGRIREGHGDLRLQHVYLTRPWSVIDPLDFSVELRFCDVAAEVGFLAMELDDLGREDAADRMVAKYAEATQDSTIGAVMPFFKRYRAVVRAKVEWIRARQTAGAERDEHLAAARRLFLLALGY
jgi:aminoglycoside phosphotransferase family enzyme